jgi:long-chain acyl-CoA synthetase
MISRTFEIPAYCHKTHLRDDIFAARKNNRWEKVSTFEYLEKSQLVASGLLSLGLKKFDKIATICSNNRPEWNFIDMGISMAGLIHVPVYPTLSPNEFKFIFNQAEIKYIFVSDKKMYNLIKPVLKNAPGVIETFVTSGKHHGIKNWEIIPELGKENRKKYHDDLIIRQKEIQSNDPATLIYTSGTTGNPKGVLLSHKNLISNMLSVSNLHPLKKGDRTLSFLPLSHIYERSSNYQFQYSGVSIYYAESLLKLPENIREVRPQALTAVPRILEKIQDNFILQGESLKGLKQKLFQFSVNLTKNYPTDHRKSISFIIKRFIANQFVYKNVRKQLGGNIKYIGCGGARLHPGIEKFLWTAGVPVFQGYGLTETSPLISLNTYPLRKKSRIGSIGPAIPGVRIKIAEDGEILCKGPNIMSGYYLDEKSTKKAISGKGWFHTGDLGFLSIDGFLFIIGRKKEIFKTSYGKYIAPQNIESHFRDSLLISQIMVVGEGKKYIGALILPNFDLLNKWIKSFYKTREFSRKELIELPQISNLLKIEINNLNKHLSSFEQLKKYQLVSDDWSVSSGEFSHNLKLKRTFISKKYAHQIQQIFND